MPRIFSPSSQTTSTACQLQRFAMSDMVAQKSMLISGYSHHRWPQQPVFDHISGLQFFKYGIVRNVVVVNHLNRLMQARIEMLTLRGNALHAHPLQSFLKLLVDQVHAFFELLRIGVSIPQRQRQVIYHRQQRTHCFTHRVVAKFSILFGRAFPIIIELSLQAREPVEQIVTLGAELLQLVQRLWLFGDGFCLRATPPLLLFEAIIGISRRKLLLCILYWLLVYASISL